MARPLCMPALRRWIDAGSGSGSTCDPEDQSALPPCCRTPAQRRARRGPRSLYTDAVVTSSQTGVEVVCPRCETWLARWRVDLDRPFDDQLLQTADGRPHLPLVTNAAGGRRVLRGQGPG